MRRTLVLALPIALIVGTVGSAAAQPAGSSLARRKALLSHDLPLRTVDDARRKPDTVGVFDLLSVTVSTHFDGPSMPEAADFSVRLQPVEDLPVVPLLSFGYVPLEVTLDGREVEFDYAPDAFEVLLFPDRPLRAGEPATFEISAAIDYPCNDDTSCASDGELFHIIDLGWYPIGLDAPVTDRYEFVVQATAARGLAVAATGSRRGPERDNLWIYRTELPTIAGAISVGPYDLVEGDIVELFLPPQNVDGGQFIGQIAADAVRFYGRLFGPYPFARLGVSAIPNVAEAAIGPQANILLPASLWLIPQAAAEQAEVVARVTAHEIGHQYFFNLIAVLDEPDAWMSEGWAEYAAVRHSQSRTGDGAHRRENYWGYLLGVDPRNDLPLSGAAVRQSPNYFEIVYLKGATVLHMLSALIGRDRFDDLLVDYVATFRGQGTTTEEFEAFMAERAGRAVISTFFAQWVYGAGFPTLTVRADPARVDNTPVQLTVGQDGGFVGALPISFVLADGGEQAAQADLRPGRYPFDVVGVQGAWVDPDLTLLRRVRAQPAADVNLSGVVDGTDLLEVWARQGTAPPSAAWRDQVDANNDGRVDGADVQAVIATFGEGW